MPGNMPKLVIPTGYESQERDIENRRKLAQLMLEKGLSQQNMTSWAQPLAEMAQIYAGKRMDSKASKAQDALDTKIKGDYTAQLGALNADVNSGMPVKDLVQKYAGSSLVSDALKPYTDAYGESLKEGEGHTTFGSQWRRKGAIPEGSVDPNSMVIPGPNNTIAVNPVRATAALAAQYPPENSSPGNMTYSMPAPGIAQPSGGGAGPGGAPPAPAAGGNSIDVSALTPEEKQILTTELQRRAGPANGGNFTVQNDMHTPFGSPVDAVKPPSGVVNGKPYWIVNGVPYDNSEGK